jgi:hypothetical protein
MIQVIIMNEVPLGPVCQALGLGFIVQYRSEMEVLENQFSPFWVGANQLNDSHYLRSGFPGLASWPRRGP